MNLTQKQIAHRTLDDAIHSLEISTGEYRVIRALIEVVHAQAELTQIISCELDDLKEVKA